MVADAAWRELARFDDPAIASAVATTIAAMEFDVRLDDPPEPGAPGSAAWVIVVDGRDWPALAEVLDEIVDEQVEFDRAVADGRAGRGELATVVVIGLTGAADLLALLGLLDP